MTHISIESFSIYLWACGSSMPRSFIRAHFARFTRRISAIFSSRDRLFFSTLLSFSRALTIHLRAWSMPGRDRGF